MPDFLTAYRQTALKPGELLTAVLVPRKAETAVSDFLKLGSRSYLVISIAMVASVIQVSGDGVITAARLAVGACSPVAQRLAALEADLLGRNVSDRLDRIPNIGHLESLSPIDDVRASALIASRRSGPDSPAASYARGTQHEHGQIFPVTAGRSNCRLLRFDVSAMCCATTRVDRHQGWLRSGRLRGMLGVGQQ